MAISFNPKTGALSTPTTGAVPFNPSAPAQTPAVTPASYEAQPAHQTAFGDQVNARADQVGKILNNATPAGNTNVLEKGAALFGQGVGVASDFTNDAIGGVTKPLLTTANNLTGGIGSALADKAVQAAIKTPLGAQGVHALSQGVDAWTSFEAKYPRAAQDLSAIGPLANLITTFATAGEAKAAGEVVAPVLGDVLKAGVDKVTSAATNAVTKSHAKVATDITEAITPKLTPTEFKAAGRAGQTSEPTLLSGSKVVGSKIPTVAKATQAIQDVASTLGKKATDVIKTGVGQVTGNLNRVTSLIGEYSDKVIKPLLTGNKVPFNFEDLQNSLNLVSPSSGLKADPSAFATYSRVRDDVLNTAASQLKKLGNASNSTDFNDIWNVRKTIDDKIENELGETTFGTPQYTGVKAAARDMRQGLTQFIDNSLRYPGQMENVNRLTEAMATLRQKGIEVTDQMLPALKKQFGVVDDARGTSIADAFKTHIDKVRSLYDAADNLETKIGTEAKSKVGQYLKAHPVVKRVGQAALTGIGLGAGAEAAQQL